MARLTTVRLPAHADPDVSLVMVVYGQYALARATLESLAATIDVAAEVIVVDNASPDGAGSRLNEEVDGPRFLLRDDNVGFGTAINLGVLHSRGRHVVLLNSDLQFEDGWLSCLVDALDSDPAAGAAVPLYLDPSGAVQSAGQLLGRDANGYGYGDRLSANAPEVSFRRRVDFGAAAALAVRRTAFDRVGGFDPIYGLGYYEDTDLAFSLREMGMHTLYVPRSRVRHAHGSSFGSVLRRQQLERNLPTFVERFGPRLRDRPLLSRPPYDPHRELIVRDWWSDDRLLLLDQRGELVDLAEAVQRRWPTARVTWVSKQGRAPSTDSGVEWIGPVDRLDRWLESRRFHYGAVIWEAPHSEELSRWLDRSQPQALRGVSGDPNDAADISIPNRPDVVRLMHQLGFGSPSATDPSRSIQPAGQS